MSELIVIRLDPVSGEWEHNHAEGPTGTQEEGEQWLAAIREGKVPEGKFCEWDEVIELVGACRKALLEDNERIYMVLKVDDHKGKTGKLTGKVDSVESKLGRQVKR